jgi:GDPmannose 4,6-dehydratase
MTEKVALIFGVTGQDGAYLAEYLLTKGYTVHGVKRRASLLRTDRIDHLYTDPFQAESQFILHHGDMTDGSSILRVIAETKPDEIYNLAAQSHVQVSFEQPEFTAMTDAIGPLKVLEAMRILGVHQSCRYYQASTSELYGEVAETPQTEQTIFRPQSPYATAKLYAYWVTRNYRDAYGIHASNGILFNHESPIRGENFVTRKVTRTVARIALGEKITLNLGNLDAQRDWGHARDFIDGIWRIVQHPEPDDWVLATGISHTVRELTEVAFDCIGTTIAWQGQGLEEVGINTQTGETLVKVNKAYFRPNEVNLLKGDASKAERILGWKCRIGFETMIAEMVEEDLRLSRQARDMVQRTTLFPNGLDEGEG